MVPLGGRKVSVLNAAAIGLEDVTTYKRIIDIEISDINDIGCSKRCHG